MTSPLSRRTALRGAALAATATVVATPAAAEAEPRGTHSFTVRDNRGRQRLLADTRRPPILIGGGVIPAEQRQGPEHGTYLIFNDENGSERGGVVAGASEASFSLDYVNAQALTLATRWQGRQGATALFFKQMPDPGLPVEQTPPTPTRVELVWSTADGAVLALNDSKGRPRIVISVDAQDVPSIRVLDEQGAVISDLAQPSGKSKYVSG
ncbi:hypothetical protein [Lentzea cavernae]|uniref:Uncharacterized protein n=1 Tax=Lentzea cavernae TaxID=2020703 RepID=A0ABQ3M392_9PSEU|nr:hypothetical protein [Lentzea cavernae]GHH32041.1 hypothetical protein GCM10017774_12240 [Lentzea cavernae]